MIEAVLQASKIRPESPSTHGYETSEGLQRAKHGAGWPRLSDRAVKGSAAARAGLTAVLVVFISATLATPLRGAGLRWGGSVRGYQFLRLGDSLLFSSRRDTEIGVVRLSAATDHGRLSTETHLVLTALTPFSRAGSPLLSAGDRDPFLPLQRDLKRTPDLYLQGALDRLNVEMAWQRVRVKVGRQAITWGVTYFWPSLDLFVPFEPQRVDRDYKAGVDAHASPYPSTLSPRWNWWALFWVIPGSATEPPVCWPGSIWVFSIWV